MKPEIHPQFFPEAQVTCACGNTFTVGATVPAISTEVCSACHPFFTGEQRIVDTAGQVERFMRRLEAGEEQRHRERDRQAQRKASEREATRRRRGLTPISARAKPKTQLPTEPADTPESPARRQD